MVATSNQPNTWNVLELQKGDIDEEMETCVGDESDKLNIAATNYVQVSKWGPQPVMAVGGQFILDLSLSPPPPSPGIASDSDRKNLTLHTESGPVTADIWIRPNGSVKSKRVSLDLFSGNGFVRAIVHDIFSPDRSSRALPFLNMKLRANFGDVYVSLPRCFRGPITIRTCDDRITLSSALEERTALISDVSGVRVYFVGDRPRSGKWGNGNKRENTDLLDELSVEGRFSSVRINWEGDKEVPFTKPNPWQVFCGGTERFFTIGRVY